MKVYICIDEEGYFISVDKTPEGAFNRYVEKMHVHLPNIIYNLEQEGDGWWNINQMFGKLPFFSAHIEEFTI